MTGTNFNVCFSFHRYCKFVCCQK